MTSFTLWCPSWLIPPPVGLIQHYHMPTLTFNVIKLHPNPKISVSQFLKTSLMKIMISGKSAIIFHSLRSPKRCVKLNIIVLHARIKDKGTIIKIYEGHAWIRLKSSLVLDCCLTMATRHQWKAHSFRTCVVRRHPPPTWNCHYNNAHS